MLKATELVTAKRKLAEEYEETCLFIHKEVVLQERSMVKAVLLHSSEYPATNLGLIRDHLSVNQLTVFVNPVQL